MDDYVKRQAAIDALGTPHGILYPIRTIEGLPSEDVAPVRHGQWKTKDGRPAIVRDGYVIEEAYCSVCSSYLNGSDEYSVVGNYCPTCGARMDGEQNETN